MLIDAMYSCYFMFLACIDEITFMCRCKSHLLSLSNILGVFLMERPMVSSMYCY